MARPTRAALDKTLSGDLDLQSLIALFISGENLDGSAADGAPVEMRTIGVGALVTGALQALNNVVVVPTAGVGSVAVELRPSANLTAGFVQFEVSYDGGTNWHSIQGARPDNGAVGTGVGITGTAAQAWEFGLPSLATHFRVRVSTAIVGGNLAARMQAGAQFTEPVTQVQGTVNAGLNASANRIGKIASDAMWWQEAITAALAAAASANGAARDLFNVASAAATGSGSMARLFRGFGTTDQPHTLYVEGSDDATTWDRMAESVSTLKGGKHTSTLSVEPVTRYARVGLTNTGAAANTFGRMRSAALAS